jgi:4,5-dihydroxyphthalate decarboxylase
MAQLQLSFACKCYDRTLPLKDGIVKPDGIDLTYVSMPYPHQTFFRQLKHQEWDVSEMSMASYLWARENDYPFIAIPVFPSRKFRHSYLFTNVDSDAEHPRQLIGKTIGITEYNITAGLWLRGILKDEYGVSADKVNWLTEREDRLPVKPPVVSIRRISPEEHLDDYLLENKIAAYFAPSLIPSFRKGDPRVRRLFRDWKNVEMDYFRRTGFFPIMHTIVLREKIYREHPWVAMSLFDALEGSKRVAYSQLQDAELLSLVWNRQTYEEQLELMGNDPFPYGVRKNRRTLEQMIEYACDQRLIQRPMSVQDMFAESTLLT